MKTSKLLVAIILLYCTFVSFGQDRSADNKDEILVRKHNLVTDLERQIKEIPFAAVRVRARYQLASWLWKDGKDDTGRAEEIATAAIDDHYKNKAEIPFGYSAHSKVFILLDDHAKDLAKRLREKYKTSLEDEAQRIPYLLGQKDGERLAVDAAINLLSRQNESSPDLSYLLLTLEQRGSPQLNTLLAAILAADDAGRTRFPTHMIEHFTGLFINPTVPDDLRKRFIRLVLARARNVVALSVLDQMAYYRTMQRLWPDISARYPEMLDEAATIHAILNARVSRSTREANESYDRIQNSPDKLAATVSEAERADDDIEKYGLFKYAARLALEKKKFVYAVDLMEKASEIHTAGKSSEKEKVFQKRMHDGFRYDVVTASLKADEPDAANHAVKKMNEPLLKAEGLRLISKYNIDKNDLDNGRYAHDEAMKLISKAENSSEGIAILIRMLPTAHRIDSSRLLELIQLTAKRINAFPSLSVDDKPDTKNYRDYVIKVITLNYDLQPALTELLKTNRNAAEDLAGRIEKKEMKIIAEYVVSTDSIDRLPNQRKKLESAILPSQ